MPDEDLTQLIVRRLFELRLDPHRLVLRSAGQLPWQTLRVLLHGAPRIELGDGLLRVLARTLAVPEHRVRRAAGHPVSDPAVPPTQPALHVTRPAP